MLYINNIKVEFECQGFKATHIGVSPDETKTVLFLESTKRTEEAVLCKSLTDNKI